MTFHLHNWFKTKTQQKLEELEQRTQEREEQERANREERERLEQELAEKQRKESLSTEELRRETLEEEKAHATANKEPWVAVLDTQVNPDNIRNGFFELDWNNEFIERLLDVGYKGESQEEIVDAWFSTIVTQMLAEEGQDTDRGVGYVNVSGIGNNRSEVS